MANVSVFDIMLGVRMNLEMATELVDLFDLVLRKREALSYQFSPQLWAFYKQLERWAEDEDKEPNPYHTNQNHHVTVQRRE